LKQIKKDPSFNILAIVAIGWLVEILALLIVRRGISSDYLLGSVLILTAIFLGLASRAHQRYQEILQDYATLNQTKSEFTSVISHQLRTPIAAARWNLELVLDNAYGKIGNKKIKQALSEIYRNLNVLNVGMDNLVTVTEIEDHLVYTKNVEFDLIQEISWLTREYAGDAAAKKIKFKISTQQPELRANTDKHKTYYILSALLSNAIAYSTGGKTITIKLARKQNQLIVAIANQGIKISAQAADSIFEKYYRSDEAKRTKPDGLGLSLFIAKVFAEACGGELSVSKSSSSQTEFTLKIPAA